MKMHAQEEMLSTLKDLSSASKRLAAWHSKMSKMQLSESSLNRELVRSREACEATSRELAVCMARVTQLEEECVNIQVRLMSKKINMA